MLSFSLSFSRALSLLPYPFIPVSAPSSRLRPYHVENTPSRPIWQVKQRRAWLVLGSETAWESQTAASLHRPLALETFYKPVIAYSTGDAIQHVKFTNLKANITVPKEVNILSIEPWDNNMVLLRLEHIYQNSELATSNKPAYIDLTNIFDAFDVRDVKETSLDGNKDPIQLSVHNQANAFDPKNVSIYPTEIRTFVMKVHWKGTPDDSLCAFRNLFIPFTVLLVFIFGQV